MTLMQAHISHALLLSALCSGAPTYSLVAVVVHLGGSGSGHYITYRWAAGQASMPDECGDSKPSRRPAEGPSSAVPRSDCRSGMWIKASDAHVVEVSREEVMAAEASLLFYEREG